MRNYEHLPSCSSFLKQVEKRFVKDGWITVHSEDIHCGLVKPRCVSGILEDCCWELHFDSTGACLSGEGRQCKYTSGYDNDVSPFVYGKYHTGETELSEEFRMLYNLHRRVDSNHCEYYGIDECGDEIIVAIQDAETVSVRVNFLKEFLALKKRHFVLFFDTYVEIDETASSYENGQTVKNDDSVFQYCVVPKMNGNGVVGWLMGKCLIKYKLTDSKNLWEWLDEGYEEFIIETTDDGEEKSFTCESSKLSNYFVPIKNAPRDITPVFFRKEVLDKYYGNPNKYIVKDGHLECKGMWSLKIDNDKSDYVIALLYELGHLPHKEQLYWKTYNVAPLLNEGLSHTAYNRWMLGAFCDTSDAPDLVFKRQFQDFCKRWHDEYDWDLFLPLVEEDKHNFTALHSLTTDNNDLDFEKQIGALTKLTIDSLNKVIFTSEFDNDKFNAKDGSITRFEVWLREKKGIELTNTFKFLRMLQDLRSNDVAHRKSSKEKKRKNTTDYFQLKTKNKKAVLDGIFVEMCNMLQTLDDALLKKQDSKQ